MSDRGSAGRRHATRFLLIVSEMHKRGFQGLRIVPEMTDDPFHWLCHLVLGVDMDPGHGAYFQVSMGGGVPYSSANDEYVWSDRPGSTARELADQLERASFSSWLEGARVDDFAYAGWYLKMLGMAERGYLPTATLNGEVVAGDDPLPLFAWPDGTVVPGHHTLPPAPRAVSPTEATVRIPDPDGPPDAIANFALSYDGYGRLGHDAQRVLQIVRPVVRQVQKDGTVPSWAGLDVLRGALFYLQREAHWTEYQSPINEREMRAVTRQIALHVDGQPLPNDHHALDQQPHEGLFAGYDRRKRAARSRQI